MYGLEVGGIRLDRNLRNHDTPGDTPLLHSNNAATDFLGSDFGLVKRYNHGSDTDRKT